MSLDSVDKEELLFSIRSAQENIEEDDFEGAKNELEYVLSELDGILFNG